MSKRNNEEPKIEEEPLEKIKKLSLSNKQNSEEKEKDQKENYDDCVFEEEGEINDDENEDTNENESGEDVVEIDEESKESGESDESDSDSDDGEIMKKILKTLLVVNKEEKKEKNKNKNCLVPLVSKYCKRDIEKRYDLLHRGKNSKIMFEKLIYVTSLITKKLIKIKVSEADMDLLRLLQTKDMSDSDKKMILAEDYRIINHIRKAINILDENVKQSRK